MTAPGRFGSCRCCGCVHTIDPELLLIILFHILHTQDITLGLAPPDDMDVASDCTEFTDLSEIDEGNLDFENAMGITGGSTPG